MEDTPVAVKQSPKLSDILARFRAAQQKTAAEGDEMPPEEMMPPNEGGYPPQDDGGYGPEDAEGGEYPEDDGEGGGYDDADYDDDGEYDEGEDAPVSAADVAEAAQAVEETENELVDAKETLQGVAEDFINEHTAALAKEAQLFGEIFASSVVDTMNRQNMLNSIEKTAYDTTIGAVAYNGLSNSASSCYSEAYVETMAKIAGYDDAEEMAEDMGMEDAPAEELAEAIADYTDSAGNLSDEAVDDLAEDLADNLDDDDLEDLADALYEEAGVDDDDDCEDCDDDDYDDEDDDDEDEDVEPGIVDSYVDEDGDVNLPAIEDEAYENTMDALQ